jgi:hypothetical protein
MKRRPNRGTYEELSGEERFRLMLQAEDRGDDPEHEHLRSTCPRVLAGYKEPEPEFLRTAEAATAVARALATGAGPMVGWLSLLEVLKEPCRRVADLLTDPPEDDQGFPFLIMQAAHNRALVTMKGMLEGFRAVCEEASLNPEVVLRVLAPHLAEALEPYRAEIEQAPTDPELAAVCTEELRAVWEHAYWRATGQRPPDPLTQERRGA